MTDAEMEDPARLPRDPLAIVREVQRQRDQARVNAEAWREQYARGLDEQERTLARMAQLVEERDHQAELVRFANETNAIAIAQRDHARAWCTFWCRKAQAKPVRPPAGNSRASDGWDPLAISDDWSAVEEAR